MCTWVPPVSVETSLTLWPQQTLCVHHNMIICKLHSTLPEITVNIPPEVLPCTHLTARRACQPEGSKVSEEVYSFSFQPSDNSKITLFDMISNLDQWQWSLLTFLMEGFYKLHSEQNPLKEIQLSYFSSEVLPLLAGIWSPLIWCWLTQINAFLMCLVLGWGHANVYGFHEE